MDSLSYKTTSVKPSQIERDWLIIDAKDMVLGRLASKVAFLLRGKHKTSYTPHMVCGDKVIVINADKVKLTGKKWTDKVYIHHTGYPGGQRETAAKDLFNKFPERLVEKAVKGMLPKNRIGRKLFTNLYTYVGDQHPHENQQPKEYKL